MKKKICLLFVLTLLCVVLASSNFRVLAKEVDNSVEFNTYKYDGKIEHFFTHQVINRPDLAFNSANKYRFNFYRDCVTYTEFERFFMKCI